ncbi:hypothetical protein CQA49_01470 [Helicobacter sp. MIT 00-7814]|uniref:hypothetical protein n=1 Tax=unclassified Helicobacter TaxID=2593540 RepID=UPI000E1F102D|nr:MULTISPECIES: hypothetical protein [unclassified Helicobacter]RDU56358.1 hypothetical protein CQA37_01915 [Helicobacter sp. MIT 99-10781]RDU56441.1 hypothetical protein CQA49_01470 [Helicobacter sp. MIT 00-7814]
MRNQTLNEQLAYLSEVGLKEISKTTKLTTNKIDDILQKRFDKIDKIRAKGFIAILEREYNLNLSEWLKEYTIFLNKESTPAQSDPQSPIAQIDLNTHIKNHTKKQPTESQTTKPLENIHSLKLPEKKQNTQQTKPRTQESKSIKNNPLIFVLLVVVALGVVGYFGYRVFWDNAKEQKQIALNSKKPSKPASNIEFATTQENTQQENTTPQKEYDGIYVDYATLPDSQNPQETQDSINQETSTQGTQNENLTRTQTLAQDLQEQALPQQLTLIPNSQLWVGIIEVESQKATHFNLTKKQEFALDKPLVFVFGHSDFTSILDGENFAHKTRNFVRFYFDGNELKEINYATYKQLCPKDYWN